jgi:high-affinity iron transporter
MLGSALIVFREVLEAALIIGIACAATRGIAGRGWWVSGGIAAGVIGACVVAAFAEVIGELASGMGQELLNASILLVAVGMLGWHNIWMARHGREMAQQMTALGKGVQSGARPLYALGAVIALAVLREGSEVVLFLYGLAAGGSSNGGMIAGSALGVLGGSALGFVMYRGLLRIPMRHFFTVTGWMILLLAAGMASQAARFLIQADLLPPLGAMLWDSSALISPDSLFGKALQTLIGYDARPAGMQLVFYVATLSTIGVSMKLFGRPTMATTRIALPVFAALAIAAAVVPEKAEAGIANKVYRPVVVQGETEVELRGGYVTKDDEHEQAYVLDLGYGITPFWFSEIVFEHEKANDGSASEQGIEWENILQLTEPGKYFVDFGWFMEAAASLEDGGGYAIETGPMLEKQLGRLLNTANLLAERSFGGDGEPETEVSYRLQSQYLSGTFVELGAQAFGEKVKGEDAQHILGPAVFGNAKMGDRNKLKWDLGVLAGLTDASEDYRIRWELEFEFY